MTNKPHTPKPEFFQPTHLFSIQEPNTQPTGRIFPTLFPTFLTILQGILKYVKKKVIHKSVKYWRVLVCQEIYREKLYFGLITQRSQVQILPPLPFFYERESLTVSNSHIYPSPKNLFEFRKRLPSFPLEGRPIT